MKRPVPGIMEGNKIRPVLLRDITTEEEARIDLKDDELKQNYEHIVNNENNVNNYFLIIDKFQRKSVGNNTIPTLNLIFYLPLEVSYF